MSTLCFRLVAHVMCGPRGPRSIPTSPLRLRWVVRWNRYLSAQKAQKAVHKRHKRCYRSEAMILGTSRLRRVGVGWRNLPCLHMHSMSTICIWKVGHVMSGPRGPRSIPQGSFVAPGTMRLVFHGAQKAQKGLYIILRPCRIVAVTE